MTEDKLKIEIRYDDGLTTYTLIDTTVNDKAYPIMSELLSIDIFDGNFKQDCEDKYHDKVMAFLTELKKENSGQNDKKDERYIVKGKNKCASIYDTFSSPPHDTFNIRFASRQDADLCCKLLNRQEREMKEYRTELNEIFKWHNEHYGKTILQERMGW